MYLYRVKQLVVIFAFFMLLKPVLPVLEYIVFYDYIKNELCENKEIVEMKCNGKCHLVKEMAKANDTQEKGKEKLISVESNIVFYQEITFDFEKPQFEITTNKMTFVYFNFYSDSDLDSVFHPPLV